MSITEETRREAYYESADNAKLRKVMIYQLLRATGVHGMTAEEITENLVSAGKLKYFDMNMVRPRLTELKADGLVKTVGKRESPLSGKQTAVWVCEEF